MWCVTSTGDVINIQTGVKMVALQQEENQWVLYVGESRLGYQRWGSKHEAQGVAQRIAKENGGLIQIPLVG